jgi:starch synthase
MAAAEMAPFAMEGGLGDALCALSRALGAAGHDVRVVLPCYGSIDRDAFGLQPVASLEVPMGVLGRIAVTVLQGRMPRSPVQSFFVGYDPYYGRRGIYGHNGDGFTDNDLRYTLLSRAAIEIARHMDWRPDVVHVHDWHTAAIPVMLNTLYRDDALFSGAATLLTIHNMLHQGVFDKSLMDVLGVGREHFHLRELEFFDKVNLLKGGIVHAALINTVSPTYAREILQPGFAYGIEGIVQGRAADLSGILNGADYDEWNPETDPLIAARYSESDLTGKALCKKDLQRAMGLPEKPSAPLFGLVTRLVKQKGIDLLAEALPRILDLDVQFVLLGSGEPWSHVYFEELAGTRPDRFACRIGFEPAMAHRVIAGSDFFVMPSRFEPCGLTQMYSMRYGTLPIVHATGGLDDTVENFDEAGLEGTGFKFHQPTAGALYDTIGWAAHTYYHNGKAIRTLMQQAMSKRFTWEEAARKYEGLYRLAMKEKRRGTAPAASQLQETVACD